MNDKSPARVLHGLEHFGVPTRNQFLQEAEELVGQGLLSREQIDRACKRYQDRIDVESLRKYGTYNPTEKKKLDYALRLLDDKRKKIETAELSANFVNMYSGKYSSGDELHTSNLGGCIATLLYFESQGSRDTHLKRDYQRQRGVVLVERPNEALQLLETGIKTIFPEITLDIIVYDQNRVGKVSLNPSQSEWRTEQHGRNSF